MNMIDAYVKEVTGLPRFLFNKWWVPVKYDCYGTLSETKVMCNTLEEALEVRVGHKFLA